MKTCIGILLLVMLSACSGKETESGSKPASNPYADEQQLIEDAKSVEDMLNKNAKEKEKAIADGSN